MQTFSHRTIRPLVAVAVSSFVGACVPTTVLPGSVHSGTISVSETWREADSPHLIEADVFVEGDGTPVLTIEAGTIVRFASGTALRVGKFKSGALKVLGTKDEPVTFVADEEGTPRGHYAGLDFGASTSPATSVSWLEMTSCGGDNGGGREQACVNTTGEGVTLKIDHLSIFGSASAGVAIEHGSTFAAGSSTLVVRDSEGPAVYVSGPNEVGTLPAGSAFTNNVRNVIKIDGWSAVQKTQTWADFGIPYQADGAIHVGAGGTPVLTLAAGVRLVFGTDGALTAGDNGFSGNLKALGTVEKPIVFTADTVEPFAGHWGGVRFGPLATPASRLEHAVVEYAGRNLGQSYPSAGVQVQGEKGAVITHSVLRNNKGCGVLRVTLGESFPTDFTAAAHANVFEGNEGGPQCDD